MKKHNKLLISFFPGQAEGFPKSFHLSFHQLFGLRFPLFVPAQDLSPAVQIKRALKSKSLGSHQGIVLIDGKVVLQEKQPVLVLFIKLLCFLGVPEHIVISPQEDLPSRQSFDKSQVLPAFLEFSPPGMVSGEHQSILWFYHPVRIFFNFLLMILPHFSKRIHWLICLKA